MFLQYGKFDQNMIPCLTNELFVVDQFLDKNFTLNLI